MEGISISLAPAKAVSPADRSGEPTPPTRCNGTDAGSVDNVFEPEKMGTVVPGTTGPNGASADTPFAFVWEEPDWVCEFSLKGPAAAPLMEAEGSVGMGSAGELLDEGDSITGKLVGAVD